MRKILYLILLPVFLFAQFSEELCDNGTFDASTGWSLIGSATVGSGVLTIQGAGGTGNQARYSLGESFAFGEDLDFFKLKYDIAANSFNTNFHALYSGGEYDFIVDGQYYFPDSTLVVGLHTPLARNNGANTDEIVFRGAGATSGSISIDNVSFRHRQDSLWVYSTGSSTDRDTTDTITDALQSRGVWNGGYIKIEAGTYSESLTLSTVSGSGGGNKIFADGGAVNITALNFNNKAIDSLDALIAKNITTPTNYANVDVYFDNTLTAQATSLVITNVNADSMNLAWTRGDGDSVIVIMKAGSEPTAPTNDTNYTDNPIFGSGSEVGTAGYVIYTGTGTTITVTGLSASTTYYVDIYEFDQALADWEYLATPLTGNQLSAISTEQDEGFNEHSKFKSRLKRLQRNAN